MELNQLTAISPIDGRYGSKTAALRETCSEFGLIRFRTLVEVHWLLALSACEQIPELPTLSKDSQTQLEKIISGFSLVDAEQIKQIEAETNHDVKAVEYFIKKKVAGNAELEAASEFVHFACTSEDINNLSYALMLKEFREAVATDQLQQVMTSLCDLAEKNCEVSMLSRTHGQPASPTTVGREIAVFMARLKKQMNVFNSVQIQGKINGAVGNFNAHLVAYPNIDWMQFSQSFVESLGLSWNPHTTQIEPHDYMAEYFHALSRINTILIDFCRDMWAYISIGYFKQRAVAGEVGSSTMPHKVNPIDYENAEGNLGLANNLLGYLASTLPTSRWQRDLTDSTTLRNIGSGFAHTLIAWQSCCKGISKVAVDSDRIAADLSNNPEVLAEAIQTVMRKHGIEEPYEKLKELTRGNKIDEQAIADFLGKLDLPDAVKEELSALIPSTYIGNAVEQARAIIKDCK